MSLKLNWACSSCGMCSGRKESVLRHIDNRRIHNGRAIPIPYLEYLAGIHRGLYGHPTAHRYLQRNRNFPKSTSEFTGRTFFDRLQEKVAEKTIEKFADDIVEIGHESSRISSLSRHFNQCVILQQAYRCLREDIFGFGGYVCSECRTINPIILRFAPQHSGPASNYVIFPCDHHSDGVPVDSEKYSNHLQERGFIEPLNDWILNIWLRGPKFKIVACRVPDPLVLDTSGNKITNHKIRLKITRDRNGTAENMVKEIVCLDHNVTKIEDMPRERSKYDPSSLACGHTYQIILDAISNTELVLDSEEGLNNFLEATKWRSFGLFRSRPLVCDQVFLVALFPLEFHQDKNLRIEIMD